MVLPNKPDKVALMVAVAALTSSIFMPAAVLAQGGSPVPGASSVRNAPPPGMAPLGRTAPPPGYGVPMAGNAPKYSAPVPGAPVPVFGAPVATAAVHNSYDRLPLNPGNAVARLEELRNLMPTTRPKDFQDSISEYCDWLADMADAHWKLAQSFNKSESTKAQADAERQLCTKFGSLKRQAMLLKAEFLISQKRYPEALNPLVDIVVSEPRTETGKNAYRLLQEIGFSEEVPVKSETAVVPKTAPADATAGSATSTGSAASNRSHLPLARSAATAN